MAKFKATVYFTPFEAVIEVPDGANDEGRANGRAQYAAETATPDVCNVELKRIQ